MNKTRQYELVYIVSPETSEQVVADLHAQIEAAVARFGCAIEKSDNWGRRKLAYAIGPHKEGIYLLDVINGTGELMKEIERRLRVNEQVLRFLVVRVDDELRAAERARARRKSNGRTRGVRGPAAEPADAPVVGQGDESDEAEA